MMKSIIAIMVAGLYMTLNVSGQANNEKTEKVEALKNFKSLYKYSNIYIGGQPTLEELQWLRSKGTKKVINLRTDKENLDFSETAFDEKTNALQLGFEYYSLPVDGTKDYTPERLNDLMSLLNKDDLIFLHCQSAGRATYFFMAYLIRNRGYTVNEAVEVGKDLRFSFPLELILGTPVSMQIIQ